MYVQLDAHFDEHPSHADLELEHFGLISCALSYCLRNLTNGHLPLKAVRGFGKSGKGIKTANQLVDLGRWTRTESGYHITDYLQHNPSKEEVLARREARAKAGKSGGIRSGETRNRNEASASPVASTLSKHDTKPLLTTMTNPSLTQLNSSSNSEREESAQPLAAPPPKVRGSRLPEDWDPKPETLAVLRAEGHQRPEASLSKFRDHWAGVSGAKGVKLDWEATFRNWVRNEKNFVRPAFAQPKHKQPVDMAAPWMAPMEVPDGPEYTLEAELEMQRKEAANG